MAIPLPPHAVHDDSQPRLSGPSGSYSGSMVTVSTSSTVPGPGALSGKFLKAVGEKTLNIIVSLIIRRRLASIQRTLSKAPHILTNPAGAAEEQMMNQIYEDLEELCSEKHKKYYGRSVQRTAASLIRSITAITRDDLTFRNYPTRTNGRWEILLAEVERRRSESDRLVPTPIAIDIGTLIPEDLKRRPQESTVMIVETEGSTADMLQRVQPPMLDSKNQHSSPVRPGAGSPSASMSAELKSHSATSTPPNEGHISISIDFGTTFSGVAYSSSRIAAGNVQQILHWPGSFETFRKVPTCLLYDDAGHVFAWGLEAKYASVPGTTRCEWFKLFLEPHALRDDSAMDPRLPRLPPGKRAVDLIADFLTCLWEYAKEQITREIGAVADLDAADVWLTIPAAWDGRGCNIMREAAIVAGLVQASRAGEQNWRDRLHLITEPEAAAVHCAHLTELHHLKPSQSFMICDAGGGTVDLAMYRIIGLLQNLEIAEISVRSGANCGSIFLDLRFRELVQTLLEDHPAHLDQASLASFMRVFSETKLEYHGESDDDKMFYFNCFNPDDTDDPNVGLVNGQLVVPGNLLRREVFDPVVYQVLELIEDQLTRVDWLPDALLLVGGFAGSEYLFKRVDTQFGQRIQVIARPSDADTATARGAVQYGLARRPLVSSVIAPCSYIMKVKLPAEPEDWQKRPAYIRENDARVPICENRLQYLVAKGAILRKGQHVKTKLCKFSATPQDRTFEAVLYTADSERMMRYTDEGGCTELCKWTVDLGTLPSFQQKASSPLSNGFYTDFELGLSVDSAEVRGVLIHENQGVGDVVFNFLV